MLTESTIKSALKRGIDTQLSDGNARGAGRLILRLKDGQAYWYAQQYIERQRRLAKIGSYPDVSLAQARLKYATEHQPQIVRKEELENAQPIGTLQRLFDGYVAHLRDCEKRSADDVEYVLNRMAQLIGPDKRANQVTSKEIVEAIRPIYLRGKASLADHMRGYVRAAYGWAMKAQNDYRSTTADVYRIKTNPAAHIPTEPKRPGERWLSVDELRAFWHWKGTRHANRNTNRSNYTALRLLIFTGQRCEEIARLSSSNVKTESSCVEWRKTKNGKPHVIPLTSIAQSLMDEVKPNEHGWYFPSEVFPERHVTDQTIRMICVRFCAQTGTRSFNPRDIRRTWKTLSAQAGLTKDERDLIQNHTKRDVSSVHYDRYDYFREKREAMEKWDAWFARNIL
jgi:integrase